MHVNVAAVERPVIVSQPTSVAVLAGGTAPFTVDASGEGPLTYQWFGPGGLPLVDVPGEIEGANSSTLRILNAQSNDAGTYRVRVANAGGAVDSAVVSLALGK